MRTKEEYQDYLNEIYKSIEGDIIDYQLISDFEKMDELINIIPEYLELKEEHRTPTFVEVVKAWEEQGLSIIKQEKHVEISSENSKVSFLKIYYDGCQDAILINPRFNAITLKHLRLLNLTIRYLESDEENNNV